MLREVKQFAQGLQVGSSRAWVQTQVSLILERKVLDTLTHRLGRAGDNLPLKWKLA